MPSEIKKSRDEFSVRVLTFFDAEIYFAIFHTKKESLQAFYKSVFTVFFTSQSLWTFIK